MEDLVDRARADGGDFESEYRIVQPDGRTRWIAGYGRVELDEQGKPTCMRGVSRDVTERRMAEDALRESEARFRTVADIAPVMIWMSGTEKQGVFFNKGWLEFTGRTVDRGNGRGMVERGSRRRPGHIASTSATMPSETENHSRSSFACGGKTANTAGSWIREPRASIPTASSWVTSVPALISPTGGRPRWIINCKAWNSRASGVSP